jgi:nucleotide-binding universal stress UspA family protein
MGQAHNRYVILAAFDHTDAAMHVGATAASVATATPGAEVHLVHVMSSEKPGEIKKHGAHVDDFARRLRQVFTGPIYGHLGAGSPWKAIVQMAANLNADMIIVGPHDRAGIERFAQGSIAEKVARHAHCPVLLARSKTHVADRSTEIEPPCPHCVETQQKTNGKELWCSQHSQHHKKGHTYTDYPDSSFGEGSEFFRD